jgi:hypothetical protein
MRGQCDHEMTRARSCVRRCPRMCRVKARHPLRSVRSFMTSYFCLSARMHLHMSLGGTWRYDMYKADTYWKFFRRLLFVFRRTMGRNCVSVAARDTPWHDSWTAMRTPRTKLSFIPSPHSLPMLLAISLSPDTSRPTEYFPLRHSFVEFAPEMPAPALDHPYPAITRCP